jgi:type II secretory pathway pseudopilin PulG
MELLIVLGIFAVIAALGLLGFGVDTRDNENWNPGGTVHTL